MGMNLTSLLAITEVQNFMISNLTARDDSLHASLRSTDQRVNEVENAALVLTSNASEMTHIWTLASHYIYTTNCEQLTEVEEIMGTKLHLLTIQKFICSITTLPGTQQGTQ